MMDLDRAPYGGSRYGCFAKGPVADPSFTPIKRLSTLYNGSKIVIFVP